MQKLGLLALAISAAAWVNSASAEPGQDGLDLMTELNRSAVSSGVRPGARASELSKRIYLYHYFMDDPFDAVTDSRSELSLLNQDVLMTIPASLMNMNMLQYASAMLTDRSLGDTAGMGNTWFMLASKAAEANQWSDASQMVDKALSDSAMLGLPQYQEALFIKVTALANSNLIEAAQQSLDLMDKGDSWYRFAKFNLMLAMMKKEVSSEKLADFLADIIDAGYDDYEQRSLQDRFLVTAGKYELKNKRYASAITYLRRISKNSAVTAEGLLQYGWALSKQWQYDQALQPWRVLQENYPLVNPSVMESFMSTAYVAELMQGGIKSLYVYEYAENGMVKALDELGNLDNEELLNNWIQGWEHQLGPIGPGWMNADLHMLAKDKVSRSLAGLLSDARFLQEQRNLQDLIFMQKWVAEQKTRLDAARQKLQQDTQNFHQQNQDEQIATATVRLAELRETIAVGENELKQQKIARFGSPSPEERAMLERLQQLSAESAEVAPDHLTLKNRIALLIGVQQWRIHEQEPERFWQQEKELRKLRDQAIVLDEQLAATTRMQEQMAGFYAATDSSLATIQSTYQKLEQLESQLGNLKTAQQQRVVSTAREHLDMLRNRLRDYLATTRLSIARLYDAELRRTQKEGEANAQ